jgi:hypothetical protein
VGAGGGGLLLLVGLGMLLGRRKAEGGGEGGKAGAAGASDSGAKGGPAPAGVLNPLHGAEEGAAGGGAALGAGAGAAAAAGSRRGMVLSSNPLHAQAAALPALPGAAPAPAPLLPPGWLRQGPNEQGEFWYDCPARNHTQWEPPEWPASASARLWAERMFKGGHGELPPEWEFEEVEGTGEIFFITPSGASQWEDPRETLAGYTAEFAAAERRGVRLDDYFSH